MDEQRRKFVIEMEKSRQSPRFHNNNLDDLSVLEKPNLNVLIELQKSRNTPQSFEKNLDYSSDSESEASTIDIPEEEEPSYLQKIIWRFTDYFEKNEIKRILPNRFNLRERELQKLRKNLKGKSEFKIRSVRDLIDRWYFKSLAKDLVNIQPEPLKMKTKIRCLNYILDAQKSDYIRAVEKEMYESNED